MRGDLSGLVARHGVRSVWWQDMRGEIALVARIVRHGDVILGPVWWGASRCVRTGTGTTGGEDWSGKLQWDGVSFGEVRCTR